MSNIKLIKDLRLKEIADICEKQEGCAKCPFLISSRNKNIHCLKDNEVRMYEVEKTYSIVNSKIDLDTNKIISNDGNNIN